MQSRFFSVHPGTPGKLARSFCCSLFLLLRAQKKKQEKGTPASPCPAGFPCFSPRAGRGKTRASPSDSSRVFFRPRLRGAAGQMGRRRKIPLARSRAPERLPKKGFALFEAQPSLQSPGSIEEHRESRPRRDKEHGGPFFGSFLWASKEMNRRMKRILWLKVFHKQNFFRVGR